MTLIYPALFHKENGSYWVEFPDLEGCQSFGDTLEETLFSAKEALEGYVATLLEQNTPLPPASDISSLTILEDSFASLVECTLSNRFYDRRAVKKTLTIPAWLNDVAIEKGVNFSSVLQNALISELHIQP